MSDVIQSPQAADESARRLSELERQLQEKEAELESRDRTVKDLTDRLSQAVERLDRVQRLGTDRITVNSAGFPKEVIKQQAELVEDLKRAVESWEGMQLGAGLGQLQLQMSDLTGLIEEHFREPEPEPQDSAESSIGEFSETESAPKSAPEPSHPEQEDAKEKESYFTAEDLCPLRPPEILHLPEATPLHLKRCVEQQESYIDYLSARLQRAAENPKSVDWDELAGKPKELMEKLERIATKLEQSRHFAEYEVALQFTRLRRKERELKQVSDELAAQMQSLGKASETDPVKDANGNRRWMRMLGMGKNESE